jgi:hypothetical protein
MVKDTRWFLLGASSNCGTAFSNNSQPCSQFSKFVFDNSKFAKLFGLRGKCKKSKIKINKLGQMKIQQTAFMLLAITLLFVLVGMFFIVFKFSGLKQSASDLQEQNALMLVSKIANYPELSCGSSYGSDMGNCVDMDKAIFLLKDRSKYKKLFGVSNIEIRKIYPEGNSVLCTLDNYPNCDILKIIDDKSKGFDKSSFVLMCRKTSFNGIPQDKCEIGKIIVRYEQK